MLLYGSTLKRLKSFVSRHGGQYKASHERDSKYWQALMLWGVPYSKDASKAKANIDKTGFFIFSSHI